MNCNCNSQASGTAPVPMFGQSPESTRRFDGCGPLRRPGMERFPVGMGYVPIQTWETPMHLEQSFLHGTIFPSLDYPFLMGRCRRWKR